MRWIGPLLCGLSTSCADPSDDDDVSDHGSPPTTAEASVTLSDNPRMVLEKRFAIELPSGLSFAELVCTSPGDPLEEHHLTLSAQSGELRLYGLLAMTDYHCVLSDDADRELWVGGFRTKALPDGFPEVNVSGDPARSSLDDGYVLFNHWRRGDPTTEVHRVVLVDNEGRPRWYVALLQARVGGISARWLGDGRVLIGGGDAISPGFYDLSGDVSFEVGPPVDPTEGYHHEALLTPEGYVLSLQGVDNVGPNDEDFLGYRIEATDPATGDVVWSFDSQDAVDDGRLPVPTNGNRSAFHANALSWINDDPLGPSVWVSMRALNVVGRIDRATGFLTTSFGPERNIALLDTDGNPLDAAEWFWGAHAPVIEEAASRFTVFDNGGSRPGSDNYSRAATFTFDDEADEATLTWAWTQPKWYEPDFGSVQFLADRHVVIGSGHCLECLPVDDVAFVLEVDPPTGDVVWRYDFTDATDTIYRAEAVDGCAFPNVRYCPSIVY